MTCFLIRNFSIQPQKELYWSLHVGACYNSHQHRGLNGGGAGLRARGDLPARGSRPEPQDPPAATWDTVALHPWADPKSRSTLGFHNLCHWGTGVQNWGFYFLDPSRSLCDPLGGSKEVEPPDSGSLTA